MCAAEVLGTRRGVCVLDGHQGRSRHVTRGEQRLHVRRTRLRRASLAGSGQDGCLIKETSGCKLFLQPSPGAEPSEHDASYPVRCAPTQSRSCVIRSTIFFPFSPLVLPVVDPDCWRTPTKSADGEWGWDCGASWGTERRRPTFFLGVFFSGSGCP